MPDAASAVRHAVLSLPTLTRFLTREEIARLHRVLDGHASDRASRRRQASIIRLLLLTGCRKGEIVNLRWREVDGDTLNLSDAKTGPRRVLLNAPVRTFTLRLDMNFVDCVSFRQADEPQA